MNWGRLMDRIFGVPPDAAWGMALSRPAPAERIVELEAEVQRLTVLLEAEMADHATCDWEAERARARYEGRELTPSEADAVDAARFGMYMGTPVDPKPLLGIIERLGAADEPTSGNRLMSGRRTEHCQSCGRAYPMGGWWHAPDALWFKVTGQRNGLRCPDCFGAEAEAKGLVLRWTVEAYGGGLARTSISVAIRRLWYAAMRPFRLKVDCPMCARLYSGDPRPPCDYCDNTRRLFWGHRRLLGRWVQIAASDEPVR